MMLGRELFETLVQNTGLPDTYVREKLLALMNQQGARIEDLDIEQVRTLLADFLLELINESDESPQAL
jgi:hypothetical protein